ncbi:hypothetical protein ACHAPJ_009760 [Fusarium lateritium]
MSSIVAVAGGNGSLGKTLVEELVLADKHQIVIFSRHEPQPGQNTEKLKTIKIDYDSAESMQKALEDNNIDTVVSTIWIYDETTYQAQSRLIDAATNSTVTKRFIASEFAAMINEEKLELHPSFKLWWAATEKLRESGLQWSRFANGFFMDYYGRPHVKTHLPDAKWIVDVEGCSAVVPGTGEELITFTYTYDVARAIVLLLDLPEWPEYCFIGGDDITANQMIKIAEHARGKKFEVKYEPLEEVHKQWEASWADGEPDATSLVLAVNLMAATGQMKIPDQRLNDRLPGYRPMKFEELVSNAWAHKP